jgi:AcrR family transcriptional regulator
VIPVPVRQGPRKRRFEQTRRDILDAAWALAEETGIAGISLREVARQVGMQAPSLYTYMASKDDLFDAMFIEGYLQLEEEGNVWTAAIDGMAPEAALTKVLEEWIRFCQASPARYQLMFTRAVPGWSPSPDAYAVSLRQYESMSVALRPLGIAGDAALDMYVAVAAGLAAQQLANDPQGDRWVTLAPSAARMMLNHSRRSEA